jgi:hypothetical protein
MRHSTFMRCLSVFGALLLSIPALAEPTPGIKTLIATPASAFDVFLQQLYVASNGPSFFGGPNMNEQLRIFKLDYDYGSNLISMSFHIGPEHKLMKGFSGRNLEGKKDIMLSAAKEIADSLGLEARDGILRIGLIQSINIRNGWSTKDFNESRIKDEIADRTVFDLVCAWEEKFIYQVRRTQTGRYEFSVDTKSVSKK